jgi:hypothetical protein
MNAVKLVFAMRSGEGCQTGFSIAVSVQPSAFSQDSAG